MEAVFYCSMHLCFPLGFANDRVFIVSGRDTTYQPALEQGGFLNQRR